MGAFTDGVCAFFQLSSSLGKAMTAERCLKIAVSGGQNFFTKKQPTACLERGKVEHVLGRRLNK